MGEENKNVTYPKDYSKLKDHEYVSILKSKGLYLKRLPEKVKNDPIIVEYAISQCGDAIQFAGDKLKEDKHLLIMALNQSENAYIHVEQIANKLFSIQELLKINPKIVKHLIKDEMDEDQKHTLLSSSFALNIYREDLAYCSNFYLKLIIDKNLLNSHNIKKKYASGKITFDRILENLNIEHPYIQPICSYVYAYFGNMNKLNYVNRKWMSNFMFLLNYLSMFPSQEKYIRENAITLSVTKEDIDAIMSSVMEEIRHE